MVQAVTGHWQDGGRGCARTDGGVPGDVQGGIYTGWYTQHGTQGGYPALYTLFTMGEQA